MGLHRNNSSESNHVNTLVRMNDGSKKGNNVFKCPIVLAHKLMNRPNNHASNANDLI